MTRDLYSFENLWRQYRACRRNKRNTANQLSFELDAEANLVALQRELREHTYRPGRSICFVTEGPKPREVFAADFRDRVVHHVLVARLEAVFEPRFIHDSYACRKGKGVLAAGERLTELLRSATCNGRRPAWALQLDVARFFASIHKETLYAIIERHVRDPELLWLTRVILFHDPTADYHFKRGPRGSGEPPSPSTWRAAPVRWRSCGRPSPPMVATSGMGRHGASGRRSALRTHGSTRCSSALRGNHGGYKRGGRCEPLAGRGFPASTAASSAMLATAPWYFAGWGDSSSFTGRRGKSPPQRCACCAPQSRAQDMRSVSGFRSRCRARISPVPCGPGTRSLTFGRKAGPTRAAPSGASSPCTCPSHR
jgi:hypothetical protein